jgi:hypothetical protein
MGLIYGLAPVILVFMALGMMMGFVRVRLIGGFLLFLILAPFILSFLVAFLEQSLMSSPVHFVIGIFILLIGAAIVFRRRHE